MTERPGWIRRRMPAAAALVLAVTAGCTGVSKPVETAPVSQAASVAPVVVTEPPASLPGPSGAFDNAALVGSWHRTIECSALRAVFAEQGLLESHGDWACQAGDPPHPHSHFFTADGQFGSHDPGGEQVDDGDYALVAPDTLRFPSHEREFGFAPILVTFAVEEVLTFSVEVPPDCVGTCADAYAWALSAFGTNPWERGDLPD